MGLKVGGWKIAKIRILALVLASGLVLVACGKSGLSDRPPQPGDVVVARVNDQPVWTSDVKSEAVAQGLIGQGEPLDISSDIFRRVLDEVVDQKLLAAESVKRGIEKSPEAQRRLAAARERILGDMLVESVVEKAISEESIQGLYNEQVRLAKKSEEIRARQIVVAALAEADALKKQLAGGAAFDSLAMEKSTDGATRYSGGDLGYFTLDVMPPIYAAMLKDARPGQVVGPFAVEAGFALLKVEDRREEKPISLDTARPQIVRFLTYDQVRDLIETLRKAAVVKLSLPASAGLADQPREPDSAPPPVPRAVAPVETPAGQAGNNLKPGLSAAKPTTAPAAKAQ